MYWLQGEPSLKDVLADPVVHAMMRRDNVDPERLRELLWRIGRTVSRQVAARDHLVERRNAVSVFN
jgi:hypothetical protein